MIQQSLQSKLIYKILTILLLNVLTNTKINTVTLSNYSINAIATYTFDISFVGSPPYSPLTLTLPNQINILSNYTVQIGSVKLNSTSSGKSIIITQSISTSAVSLVVTNIQNPNSAIKTNSFSYSNANQNHAQSILVQVREVKYIGGTFAACPWSFTLCTQQPNSQLTIPVTTINKIPAGDNYILINYPTTWSNLAIKSLTSSVTALTCSYSINGGLFIVITSTSQCTFSGGVISMLINIASELDGGASLIVKISGVNSPPTQVTPNSISYSISTADINKLVIDTRTSCPINNVCVMNYSDSLVNSITSGFSSIVGGDFGSFQIKYLTTPTTITFIQEDSVEVHYYDPLQSLSSCSLTLYRSQSINFAYLTAGSFITYNLPLSSSGTNSFYSSELSVYFQCPSGFTLPDSQTPEPLTMIFKRKSSEFLQLKAQIKATAAIFNSLNGKISATSNQMATINAAYTFNFLIGKPLSNSPKITIKFNNDYTIGGIICTVAILGSSVSGTNCSEINKIIQITFKSSTSKIDSGANITITINGITNPLFPKTYTFQMTTYYLDTVATSKVQYNLNAFSFPIVGITNYDAILEPAELSVYKVTTSIITLTNLMNLPSGSLFSVEFPVGTINIAAATTVLTSSGSSVPISTPALTTRTATFNILSEIQLNKILKISFLITTPKSTGDYTFVKLTISYNSIVYISSTNSMYLKVSMPSVMTATIISGNSITGGNASYTLDLTLSIPHDATFVIQIKVPADITFISSGSKCSNCVSQAISPIDNTTFKFTANNSFAGQISKQLSYNIQSFINPRSVGLSSPFIITTKTLDDKLISNQTAQVDIVNPSILSAFLIKSQEYYRNNTNPVKISLTFTNNYIIGDYLQILFTSSSYTPISTINCNNNFGVCSIKDSTTDTTTIKVIINETNILNKSITIYIQGLKSSSNTLYGQTSTINVATLTSTNRMIDKGQMFYNLSCTDATKNCKRCTISGDCIECYVTEGFYLSGVTCVSQCGPPTNYLSYANNVTGKCTTCINNCYTCNNASYCTSCNGNYFLYTNSYTCQSLCAQNNGYYKSGTFCIACITSCLTCTNSGNSCTRCNNMTFLKDGLCASSCGSVGVYNLNGNCFPCHTSCLSCTGGGEDKCTSCSLNYFKHLGFCVLQCPYGTGNNPLTGQCSCHPTCILCSDYTTCLSCANSDYFVYNGNCRDSCPMATYLSQGVCHPCSTGCQNCTINTCSSCINNNKLYNNICYSDCNLISQQFDVDITGLTCVLCPDGCDRCSDLVCISCLAQYSLNNDQCIKTCMLTDSCSIVPQTPLPMPGLLTFVVWLGIVMIVKLIIKQNYIPYSLIFFSAIIQLVLIFAMMSSVNATIAKRLLATNIKGQRQTMIILLGISVAFNYIFNFIFVGIFIKYFKPLIKAPRQIDIISYIAMLIIGTCTNFRFCFIAFARMFPKPYIFIQNPSKLTPIHYLCLSTILFDIMIIVACGIAIFNELALTNTYMLGMDLLIIILINTALTIWFLASQKPKQYFKQSIVKYQTQDNIKNQTNQTLPNQKDLSKHNMIANQSLNYVDDLDQSLNNTQHQYTKFNDSKTFKVKSNKMNINDDEIISQIKKPSKTNSKVFEHGDDYVKNPNQSYIQDINYQQVIPSKHGDRSKAFINSYQDQYTKDLNKSIGSSDKMNQDNLSLKQKSKLNSFGKVPVNNARTGRKIQRNIQQLEENDDNDVRVGNKSDKKQIFDTKQKIARPKKLNSERKDSKMMKSVNLNKKDIEPLKIMKKSNNIGIYQTDAFQSNTDGEDIEAIIKNKIWQSQNKFSNQKLEANGQTNQETGYEQISPSWFNIQNQRLDIEQFEQSSQS